jgi:adenosine deaminase
MTFNKGYSHFHAHVEGVISQEVTGRLIRRYRIPYTMSSWHKRPEAWKREWDSAFYEESKKLKDLGRQDLREEDLYKWHHPWLLIDDEDYEYYFYDFLDEYEKWNVEISFVRRPPQAPIPWLYPYVL